MNRITIDNYEAYLLDLLEGTLSGELQVELELFLIQHPELKTDLVELPLLTVDAEEIPFAGKPQLKKTDHDLVSQEQFIAYIENQLPLHERIALEKSCNANPSLSTELNLYKKTIATADTSVVYANKQELKRRPKVIWFNFSAAQFAAAASVLLLIGLFVFWPKSGENNLNHHSLAENNSKQTTAPLNNNSQKQETSQPALPATTANHNLIKKNTQFTNEPKLAANSTQSNTTTAQNSQELPDPNLNNGQTTVAQTPPVTAPVKEEKNNSLLASNTKTRVDVITETDEEEVPAEEPRKKGIWALAKRTLKNLNAVGVKSVNGTEENAKDNTTYALTLGNVKITHKEH